MMDGKGHALLRDRIRSIPDLLEKMFEQEPPPLETGASPKRFTITGTGSSEAHGRFLAHLVNSYTGSHAVFRPLSSFLAEPAREEDGFLVVFSQGLSPNATVALRRAAAFQRLILFTSATQSGLEAAKKADRARLIARLKEEGALILHYPLEEEYTTLIRMVGPMAGYLAVAFFVARLEGSRLRPPDRRLPESVARAPGRLPPEILEGDSDWAHGFHLVSASPLVEFGQNLSYKFLEGLFIPAPPLWDLFQFAHGPFQQNVLRRRPIVLLSGEEPHEKELEEKVMAMSVASGCHTWILRSALPPVYRIFDYESMFNSLLLAAIERLGIDQVNWPGKGSDGPLYSYGSEG